MAPDSSATPLPGNELDRIRPWIPQTTRSATPVKTAQHVGGTVEYVEVTLEDITIANRLAAAVLGRTLDELPPQTRRLLAHLEAYVARRAEDEGTPRGEVRFTRRQLREALKWGDTQLHLHLSRLESLEYVASQRGLRGGFAYQLLPVPDAATASAGLTEVSSLGSEAVATTPQLSGAAASFRTAFGAHSGSAPEASTRRGLSALKPSWPAFGLGANAHSALAVVGAVVPGEVP